MQAMLLERAGTPLRLTELPTPEPGPDELRLDVAACAVCRTDLHVVDGELTQPKLPLVMHAINVVCSLGSSFSAAPEMVPNAFQDRSVQPLRHPSGPWLSLPSPPSPGANRTQAGPLVKPSS